MNASGNSYVTGDGLDDLRDNLRTVILNHSLLRGEFTLSSGAKSSYYLDLRKTTLHPAGCHLVGEIIFRMLDGAGVTAVGGPTLGADPMVASVAGASHRHEKPIPAFIVRKAQKEHGTGKTIEGLDVKGLDVAIIEDVVTKGGSVAHAIRAAAAAGANIKKVICLVDRLQGGGEVLKALGEELGQNFGYEAVFTIEDLGIMPD